MKPALLIKVKRSVLTEREHSGFILVVDKNEKIISQVGNTDNFPIFLRSCAKPFQALPVITSGAYSKFNFSPKELAICCASHSAANEHLEIIRKIFNKTGLNEKCLQCGIHEPFDIETRNHLIKYSLKVSQIHNNCSGKHVGMLAACISNGWNIENYLDFDHPLQKEILNIIKKYCNCNDEKIISSIDNCSAPVYGIPLYKMGVGYLRLFLSAEGELIKRAYLENPVIIGGKGRLDSAVMESGNDQLICKTGAEGLCIAINIKEEKALVIKIMDSNNSARSLVMLESLKQLGWIAQEELNNKYIQKLMDPKIQTLNNITIGEIQFNFKLD